MGRCENFAVAGKRANGVKCFGDVELSMTLSAASQPPIRVFAMKRLDQFWPAPAHFFVRLDGARYLDNGASRGFNMGSIASRVEHAIRARDAYGFRHRRTLSLSSRSQNPIFCSVPGPQSL